MRFPVLNYSNVYVAKQLYDLGKKIIENTSVKFKIRHAVA